MQWIYRREDKPEKDLEPLFYYMFFGTLIGARLGHCFFYNAGYYLSNPVLILKVWEGGLASHGGLLGIITALFLFSRKRPDQPLLWILDRMVIPTALAGFFIRTGNLFNSEIIGLPAEVPWAVIFKHIDHIPRHPAMVYESLSYLAIFIILLLTYRKTGRNTPHGFLLGIFLTLIFGARFLIEFVKERHALFMMDAPISMGQLLSIPLVAAGIFLLLKTIPQLKAGTEPSAGTSRE